MPLYHTHTMLNDVFYYKVSSTVVGRVDLMLVVFYRGSYALVCLACMCFLCNLHKGQPLTP